MEFVRLTAFKTAIYILSVVAAYGIAIVSDGATYTYVQNKTAWNGSANWVVGDKATVPLVDDNVAGVPSLMGDVAILQQNIKDPPPTGNPPAAATITLATTDMTVGALISRNDTNIYTTTIIANSATPGKLIFDNGGDTAQAQLSESGPANASTNSIRLRITAPVQLKSDLLINQSYLPDRNTVTEFAGPLLGSANITITKIGIGNFQLGHASDGTDAFLGDVDVQVGGLRLIIPNGSSAGTTNTMLSQSKGVYIHDGAQIQLGNTMNVFSLGVNASTVDGKAELTLEGIGDTSDAVAQFPEGALRFDQTAGTALNCDFNSPIKLVSTASNPSPRIYVTSSDVAGKLNSEVRGDATAGLIKGGTGLLKMMAPNGNSYAGTTNITKGLLSVNNTNAATSGVGGTAANAMVLVNDTGTGAALGGTGYIGTIVHPVNVVLTGNASSTTGARLYPGDINTAVSTSGISTSVGTLTIHGGLSFDAMSSLNVDMTSDTAYDKVVVDGAVALGSAGLNFTLGSFLPSGNGNITLIDNQGAGSIAGTFGALNGTTGTLAEGAAVTVGTATYHITYQGGTGNDVVLVGATLGLPGDYNQNGVVDAADYVLWRKNDSANVALPNDNGAGTQAARYTLWRSNFGNGGSGSGSSLGLDSVPEPATILLVALISPLFSLLFPRRKLGRTRL